MADVVIETGTGNSALVISGTPQNYQAEDFPVQQNTTYLPAPSDPLLVFIEDTISISSKARKLQLYGNSPSATNPRDTIRKPPRLAGSANPFIRTYEQSARLHLGDGNESYALAGDRVDISEQAYRLIQI